RPITKRVYTFCFELQYPPLQQFFFLLISVYISLLNSHIEFLCQSQHFCDALLVIGFQNQFRSPISPIYANLRKPIYNCNYHWPSETNTQRPQDRKSTRLNSSHVKI